MQQKRVLIITYYWPPSGGGGVQRWMYFAMYLSRFGFTPTVITVHPDKASYPLIDKSQSEFVKDIDTIHTNTSEPLKIYSLLKSGSKNKGIPYGNLGENSGSKFGKIMAFIRANFFIPDARKGWVSFAKKAASKALQTEKYEWLITTGPPHSTHLTGLYLSEKFKINWLADFRDPWSEIYFIKNTFRFDFAKRKDQRLESKVLNTADIVTTVGPGMAELFSSKLRDPSKLHILFNGYDKEMFEGIEKRPGKNNRFKISHIGLLGNTQRFDSFIKSLKNSELNGAEIQIQLAGSVDACHLEDLESELPGSHILHTDFLPRREALELMKNSDLLLLCPPMVGETRLIISTKTMEYLAAGVPVLGIGDVNSDAALLVKKQSFSCFFDPENVEEAALFISQSFNNWKTGKPLVNDFDPEPYSRLSVAAGLAEILNSF